MKAIILGKSISFKGKETKVDDLFNEDFYKESNEAADKFLNSTYGVNEVFMNLIQPYMAIEKWINNNNPSRIYLRESNEDYAFYAKDICDKAKIETKGYHWWLPLKTKVLFNITVLSSAIYFLYLLFKIPYDSNIKVSPKFSVLRTKAAIKKFKKFDEIQQEKEDPYDKNSIYRLFPRKERLKWIFMACIRAFSTYNEMRDFYEPHLGKRFHYALMNYYKKRIVYAEVYRQVLDSYFVHFRGSEFYTGNNLDRFSVIEDDVCKKHSIKSYCIPHGIEYGFKFPKGFSSDVFYTHSQYTADYLNKLYKTSKYVYDDSVIRRMFEYHYEKQHEQMVIFFTESREVNVNQEIVTALLPLLKEAGLKLYLKLHPMDNKSNYDGMDIDYISDYDLSMTGNICISRKSTILIEAIYNHSIPIAIITNPKDRSMFNTFPSLNAKQIIKTYSVDELMKVIISYRKSNS